MIFTPIQVGDYGKINKKTGDFEKEDNIYSAKATADLVSQYPPIEASKQDKIEIVSETAKRREFSAGVDLWVYLQILVLFFGDSFIEASLISHVLRFMGNGSSARIVVLC